MKSLVCCITLIIVGLLSASTHVNAQSKKKQIALLTYLNDSLFRNNDSLIVLLNLERLKSKDFLLELKDTKKRLAASLKDLSKTNAALEHAQNQTDSLDIVLFQSKNLSDSLSFDLEHFKSKTDSLSIQVKVMQEQLRLERGVKAKGEDVVLDYLVTGDFIATKPITMQLRGQYVKTTGYKYQISSGQEEEYAWLKISKAVSVEDWEGALLQGPSALVNFNDLLGVDPVNVHQVKFIRWLSPSKCIIDFYITENNRTTSKRHLVQIINVNQLQVEAERGEVIEIFPK